MLLSPLDLLFETLLQPLHLMIQILAVRHIAQLRQVSFDRSVITTIFYLYHMRNRLRILDHRKQE